MKKIIMNVISVIMAVALVLVPLSTTPAKAANDAEVVARFTYSGQVYEYDTLSQAIADASTVGNLTVYLVSNYTLPADLEIPSNVTVTIPTSADYNDTNVGAANVDGIGTTASAYVTLTVPKGVTLDVKGTLLVAGNQQGSVPKTGFLTGSYGAIDLEGDIVVGGKLYARGEISGAGTVTANNGGSVYQRFEINDWRGGNASQGAYDEKVFPFNLYSLKGISSKEVYNSGSALYGQAYITASIFGTRIGLNVEVPYVGNNEDDYLVFSSGNGSIDFVDDGDITTVSINNISLRTSNLTFNYPFASISSENLIAPFGYNTNVALENGGELIVRTMLKFLPGCTFTVEEGSTLNISKDAAMYFYSEGVYQKAWCDYSGEWGYENAAVLNVTGGTVNNEGILASSSESFGNILGLGTITNGGDATVDEVTQSGTSVTVVHVPFYKAVLPTAE